MERVRLTMAQALVRALAAQRTVVDGIEAPLFGGVFAIFGHGNVAGLGQALAAARESLPTFRAHNEQAMGHAAVAFAKASRRRRMMACTTSIGPGATNLVTAAATAHVNRLPVLLLPGDVFASRAPDPVLQQLEDFGQPAVTANDCLGPVSRFFDRIWRPEQLVEALPAALGVLTDPADCGPATLALPQDVQAEAFDFPADLFARRVHAPRRPRPDRAELSRAATVLSGARRPLAVAGGGVHYSDACAEIADFASRRGIPVAETQAGKGALVWDHPLLAGAIGVTGSAAANELAREADVILCVGTRLSDFTTASRTLFEDPGVRRIGLNVAAFDARKHGSLPLVADAREALGELDAALGSWRAPEEWTARARRGIAEWNGVVDRVTAPGGAAGPLTDAQVLGAVNRASRPEDVVVCAAGGLPGELHKLWRTRAPGGYHAEYGYSCMGYEIAGGLGVRMARGGVGEVLVLVGDGSYLMMSSEIATSVAMGCKLTIVLCDNRGFGCIHRLQRATGGEPFRNLLSGPPIDLVSHARSLGASAVGVRSISELEGALAVARDRAVSSVIVVETDPQRGTEAGGAWWEVGIPEVSESPEAKRAREHHERMKERQR
ncbi:MAG: 3D-(3,5/4)-trihydroxycyclohexane-1,2-dione acylhydrolase (decyclizing) [Deltaproteobacteria bacterium]|nr:3D-(3,5/4)-trihydroxycyclohexane-1,2-dione acylhydrolase (decyclizing) [Deltaproteobacteria bacterium]